MYSMWPGGFFDVCMHPKGGVCVGTDTVCHHTHTQRLCCVVWQYGGLERESRDDLSSNIHPAEVPLSMTVNLSR